MTKDSATTEILKVILLKQCCKDILRLCKDPFAHTYTKELQRQLEIYDTESNEVQTQILYVLNNLRYWRGSEAKAIKEILKSI